MQPLVQMQGIDKAFSGVVALKSANLQIEPGEVHALIGQNGAGKSTLVKILTGVYRRDAGKVFVSGDEPAITCPKDAQKSGIATIYQELNLVPLRSVTENVVMGDEPRRFGGLINWPKAHARAREILGRFGIDVDVKAPLGSYSTAIQQLVAIARAVSADANLVIMDEPTSSLDDREVATLFRVVKELKSAGVAVLYISHFLDELFAICDRVTIMRDGQTVAVHEIAASTKLGLIADMLGRDPEEIQSAGMTELGGGGKLVGEKLLEVQSVGTSRAINDISLSVHKGEIVGLGGLLGSGRTETAQAIFGVDALKSGSIKISRLGKAASTPTEAINSGLGFLTEDRKAEGIIPSMSVRENMTLALLPQLSKRGMIDFKKERKIVEHFIKALGIKTAGMEQPIRELSGGNQQKVLLARWLANEPELLILDEPTRGVDVGAKFEIQSIIRSYVERGVGVLLISSEFEELVEGADRIVVLQDGYSIAELSNPGITEDALLSAIASNHSKSEEASEANGR